MTVYEAERLVLAPGAWAPELLADLELPLEPERRVICWFEPEGDAGLFSPAASPSYLGARGRQRVHLLPARGGRGRREDRLLPRRRRAV